MENYTFEGYLKFGFYLLSFTLLVVGTLKQKDYITNKILHAGTIMLIFSFLYKFSIEWYISNMDFSVSFDNPPEATYGLYKTLYHDVFFVLQVLAIAMIVLSVWVSRIGNKDHA
jgi:hypothetical protein